MLGKLHYFGKAVPDDNGESAQAALEQWLEQKDDLLAGRVPRPIGDNSDGKTLRELVNYGNSDVGYLPMKSIDLKGEWVACPRQKTGIARRCPLWPETVAAIREWLAMRPAPADEADANLVFLTCRGYRWLPNLTSRPLTNEMRELLVRLKIGGKRSFYSFRHTFATIGGDNQDQIAVDYIMGHGKKDMATVYSERVFEERLRAVAEHVRR